MSDKTTCDVICVHEDKVHRALNYLNEETSQQLMELLLTINDKHKLKIMMALMKEEELCVCDLSAILGMSITSTSHHLRLLYKKEVLDFCRKGKMTYYSIKNHHVAALLTQCMASL
ncbi:ArsR/SmtB family transcription factor [Staphylococcus sp. 11261D007BR]